MSTFRSSEFSWIFGFFAALTTLAHAPDDTHALDRPERVSLDYSSKEGIPAPCGRGRARGPAAPPLGVVRIRAVFCLIGNAYPGEALEVAGGADF